MSSFKPAICGEILCGQTVCGIERTEQFTNISAADYGENPKVNLATGRMVYEEQLLSVGSETYQISVSAIYNSHRSGVGICGCGWSLSTEQRLINSYGKYYLVGSGGDISEFSLFDEAGNKYYNASDAGQVLTVSDDGSACLADDDGNIVNFDAEGKPINAVSGYNAAINKVFEYDDYGRLYRIYDERFKSGSRIKSYILFEYAGGKLASVTAYDNYTKKRDRRQFEYDGNILVRVRRTAYNSNGIKTLSKEIKSYHYKDYHLIAIVDEESLSAVKLIYSDDRVSNVISGVIDKGEIISLGMRLHVGDALACTGSTAAAVSGEIIDGGAFVSKKSCAYSYLLQNNKCYGARLTNETGIETTSYLDEHYRIVSSFESSSNKLLTLKKETGVILSASNGNYGSMRINGRNVAKITGSVYYITLSNFNISHYERNENKYYDCSFWLRHYVNEERLKVKFEYKLSGESSYRSQYVWINGRANNAWQKVSATIALNRDGEGKYNSKSVTNIRITLYKAGNVSVSGYEVSYLIFNPSPQVTTMVGSGSVRTAIENIRGITITAKDKTYTVTDNGTATEIYFTEGDILRSLMNKHKKLSRGESDTYFDVVCNDGAKRLSNVKELTFKDGTRQYNLATAENPIATEMITADAKIKVQQKYIFRTAEFAVESINNYYENGTEGGGTDNDRQTENSRIYNYYGQELSETDEYGIKKVYEYNEYGQLINRQIIGSDSSVGQSSSIEYAAGGGAASWAISGYDYHTYGYNSPFGMLTDIVGGGYNAASGAYDRTGDKQTFEYGGYNDRVVKTSRYDWGTLSGSNEITYENGRIRTVSDGYVKYGQKHDFVNDKVEYTRFNGDDEEVVQTDRVRWNDNSEIYTHESSFKNNSGSLTSAIDKYNRLTHIYTDNGAATFIYQDGDESAAVQKLVKLQDTCERTTTEYFYDAYDNLCGWKKGDNHLEIQQIAAGTTKYTFGANEKYFCNITYDSNKILSPRITGTAIFRDPNTDGDDDIEECKEYTKAYEYDKFGRLTNKRGEYTEYVWNTASYYKSNEFTAYKEVNGYNTAIPEDRTYTVTTYNSTNILYNTTAFEENYDYDERGRLKQISNHVKYSQISLAEKIIYEKSQTKSYTYDNMNRLQSESDSIFGYKTYSYGVNGKISRVTQSGAWKNFEYNELDQLSSCGDVEYTYDEMGNRATKRVGSSTIRYKYVRGNLLSEMSGFLYNYNCNGVRYQKYANGVTTTYYLDGEKILGEDRSDGTKLRYIYDIDGISGIIYNGNKYECVRNAYGDVILIVQGGHMKACYHYDAWGNCTVEQYNDANDIGNINPFRWKGHYYDAESGLYYANGSYYDPEVGLHVDAMPVSSLIENAFKVFGLDLNGLMCDNILAYLPCVYSIFTTLELSPDPLYDKDANKSGWELFWQGVGEWFNGVTKWFDEIDIGIKIGVGLLLFAAACALVIISAPTGAAGLTGAIAAYTGTSSTIAAATVTSMAIAFAVGIASATAMSAAGALLSGGDVVEAMTNAAADAVFWGGVFAFISAGINALKTVSRTTYNAKLPGSSQTGAQPCSTVNQCFKEGTLVETEEGLKPIEEIAVGDKVLAFDETTGEQAYKPVVQLFRNTTKEWYHIHVNDEEIICTGGHPFYVLNAENDRNIVNFEGQPQNTKGAWICANELKVSDELLLANGTVVTIDSIHVEKLSKPETTYNFEVSEAHTYYVSDAKVLVHNKCPGGDYYRGGNDMTASIKEVKFTDEGLVKTTHGISVNTDPSAVSRFGTPNKIIDIPDGLKIIQRGANLSHYEIVPTFEMPFSQYQKLLYEITLKNK